MLQKGSVVLYKNQCALITECGEKYTIVFAKTSQSVREKDVALLHRGPASSLAQAMCECVAVDYVCNQLNETWELLQDDEESCFGFSYLAELTLGDFPVEKAWSFYSALSTHPRFVMLPLTHSKEPCFSLRSQEEYEAITAKQTEKEKESELREAFIKRLKQKKLNLPEDGIFMSEVESFALGRTLSSKIMKEAGFSCTEQKAHALLLDTGIWNMSRNPYPSRWGLSLQSAKEPVGTPIDEERMQVQHTAYAIDNSTTGDPDDAIAFDGEYLWVHVTDPAGTVVPDSPTDLDARFRGSTLYLPEGTSRMLEESSLAEYALGLAESLDPPRMSRALSFRLKPDADGI
ncbi:MAG: RNB domain-containing ribonuclease, partial [Spirochaetales bacterium]